MCNYEINVTQHTKCGTILQIVFILHGPHSCRLSIHEKEKNKLLVREQEGCRKGCRKDVRRAFGFLQDRSVIVHHSVRGWSLNTM
jgi:hypothetical protein